MHSRCRGFAILSRRGRDTEILDGDAFGVGTIQAIPLPQSDNSCVLAIIPFRQISERGYTCLDDKVAIQVLVGNTRPLVDQRELTRAEDVPFRLSAVRFEPDDAEYESLVADVIHREITSGLGSNFVINRCLRAQADTSRENWLDEGARKAFSYLVSHDPNAYWRFWIRLPELTLIGSSPELHLGFESGRVRMTPMSGTLRLDSFTGRSTVRDFIDSRKEIEELFMVLDEELKMVCGMNPSSITIQGPHLEVFGNVAHTYFEIDADTTLGVHDVLRQSLLAPTVTGSPLRQAFDVIARNERGPRGYYGGVLCHLKRHGQTIKLDSAIAIRTAYITPGGQLTIPVGATIVRHSAPHSEVAETTFKAAGLLAALRGDPATMPVRGAELLLDDVPIRAGLQDRRRWMSDLWLSGPVHLDMKFENKSALIVDFDDDWTSMLAYLISSFGFQCKILGWRDLPGTAGLDDWFTGSESKDLLVLGPGPGDPMDESDPRIRMANQLAGIVETRATPTLAVCLSHQCLSRRFGLRLTQLTEPTQGTARSVRISDEFYSLAFYNSYAAYYEPSDTTMILPEGTEVWFDTATGEVFGFAAPRIVSVQFHLESAISRDGTVLADILLSKLLT